MKSQGLILLLLCAFVAPGHSQDKKKPEDPIIKEFRVHFSDPDFNVRRDQIERLSKVQTADSVALLVAKGLHDSEVQVRAKASWSLAQMQTPEARAAVLEAFESSNADVREGIAVALGIAKGFTPSPIEKLTLHLLNDGSSSVKAASAEALGLIGDKAAGDALTKAVSGSDEAVIIAAADALCLLKAPQAAEALIKHLNNPSWRVQTAALGALASIRVKESIDPIIKYLAVAEGRPRVDAHQALMKITKCQFAMDAKIWQEWWDRTKAEWTVPPDGPKGEQTVKTTKSDAYGRKEVGYVTIPVNSKRVLFVIDISTSMQTPILIRQGKKVEGADPITMSAPKIKIARDELRLTLQSIDPETRFNLIAFETDVRFYQPETVSASPANVVAAMRWIESQKARPPTLDQEGRTTGRTNTYGALRAIFGFSQKKGVTGGTTGGGPPKTSKKPLWDTVFFLSDGLPTEGDITDIPTILSEVTRWNKTAKIKINCIGMEHDVGLTELMEGIANITGGKTDYVGK